MRRVAGVVAAAGLAAALSACGGSDATGTCSSSLPPPVPVAVTPSVLNLAVGAHAQVLAQGAVQVAPCRYVPSPVRWDASDSSVVSVQPDTGNFATVTGKTAGTSFVVATFLEDTTVRAAALVKVGAGTPPGQQ